jgi:hypothetical protein
VDWEWLLDLVQWVGRMSDWRSYGSVDIAALSVGGSHERRDEEDGGAHICCCCGVVCCVVVGGYVN